MKSWKPLSFVFFIIAFHELALTRSLMEAKRGSTGNRMTIGCIYGDCARAQQSGLA